MASIPGFVYLFVGIGVVGTAYYMPKMYIFRWIGFLFLAAGIFKIIVRFVVRDHEAPIEKKHIAQKQEPEPFRHLGRACPQCGNFAHQNANFCMVCGLRLR